LDLDDEDVLSSLAERLNECLRGVTADLEHCVCEQPMIVFRPSGRWPTDGTVGDGLSYALAHSDFHCSGVDRHKPRRFHHHRRHP
jgi:hypothetical protein